MNRLSASALLLALSMFQTAQRPAATLSAFASTRSGGGAQIAFVANAGQADPAVRFEAIGSGATLFATDDGLWLWANAPATAGKPGQPAYTQANAPESQASASIKIGYVGANQHPHIEPFGLLPARVSFLIGDQHNWHTSLAAWAGIRYVDIYSGIDLELTSEHGQLVQRIVAHGGANPGVVRMQVSGAERMQLSGGQLQMTTSVGELDLPLPQLVSSTPRPAAAPSLAGSTVSQPFAPTTPSATAAGATNLAYAVAVGGTGYDHSYGIAVDQFGAAYVTGWTNSLNFTPAPGDPPPSVSFGNAFVAKLGPNGGLVFATFIGGQGDDAGLAIAVDQLGAAYITGATTSSDFPTTAGAYDRSYTADTCDGHPHFPQPCPDAFVAKLDPSGSGLAFSTLLGGADRDVGVAIALGADQTAYIAGITRGGVAATPGAFDTTPGGGLCPGFLLPNSCTDGFVAHVNTTGTGLLYSTLLSGKFNDSAVAIAIDPDGDAYVAGSTNSPDFPVTPGAYDTTLHPAICAEDIGGSYPCYEGFVAKLNPAGSAATYATLLGGQADEQASAIAIDADRAAYVVGQTRSADFPTTPGAFQRALVSEPSCSSGTPCADAFAAKLNPAGSKLAYATLLGGKHDDAATSIAVNAQGETFLAGTTKSADFPVTPGAASTALDNDLGDAFVTRLDQAGSALAYSSFVGGLGQEQDPSLAIDAASNAYLASSVNTAYVEFPPAAPYASGDAFVVKFATPPFIYRTTAVVGPGGGSFSTVLDATSYTIPGGAFGGTATLTHTTLLERDTPAAWPLFSIGHSFENTATLTLGGQPAQPARPYSITIHYTDAEKSSALEDTLTLYVWDGTAWVREPSSQVNTASNTITATPNHFGRWAVLGSSRHTFLPLID